MSRDLGEEYIESFLRNQEKVLQGRTREGRKTPVIYKMRWMVND